jgi:DnaJ family protein B protein 12
VVSRAFQVLSDPDKRKKYDTFGGDPDNRFGAGSSASTSSPFDSGFGRTPGSARQGPVWEEEISPEELFNRFFGGGGGFAQFGMLLPWPALTSLDQDTLAHTRSAGGFDAGPQVFFNMGGSSGFRVHQFGGSRPRRRPHDANGDGEAPTPTISSSLSGLLPLILLVLLPLLSTLFSTSMQTPAGPSLRFDSPSPPYTMHRTTPRLKVDYYLNPEEVSDWSVRRLNQLDAKAELNYVNKLQVECENEIDQRGRLMQDAQGWFFQDVEKMNQARSMELRSCRRLDDLRNGRGVGY